MSTSSNHWKYVSVEKLFAPFFPASCMPQHLFCNQFPVCLTIRLTGLSLHLPIGIATLNNPSVRGAWWISFASTLSREVPNGDLHFSLVVLKNTKISAARIRNCFWLVIGSGLSCFRSCNIFNYQFSSIVMLIRWSHFLIMTPLSAGAKLFHAYKCCHTCIRLGALMFGRCNRSTHHVPSKKKWPILSCCIFLS